MMKRTRLNQPPTKSIWVALALAASLGLLAGCSAIPPIPGIPDVSVDDEGGSITLNGDGNESVNIDVGTDDVIPEWLPSELPLPSEYTVVNSTNMESSGGTVKGMNLTTPDDFETVVATIDDGFAAAGLTPETREIGELAEMKTGLFGVTSGEDSWVITVLDYGIQDEEVQISYVSVKE
ncbi:MAG: hypothetical protein ACTIJ6_06915 [Leucobacter sp.]